MTEHESTASRITHLAGGDIPGIARAVVIESGRIAYLSGHVPQDSSGRIPTTFEEQLELTFEGLAGTLADLGATPHDIVKMTSFVVGLTPEKIPAFRQVRDRFLGSATEHPPASTLLGVAALFDPAAHVEIELVVSLPLQS